MIENKDQIKYAWKWFEFHADQRLRAFYYYLLIIGALAFGYLTAKQDCSQEIIPLLCSFGFVVSIAFLCIEIRNVELVNIGRFVLEGEKIDVLVKEEDPNYTKALEKTLPHKGLLKIKNIFKHELWLRFIYVLIALISIYLIFDFYLQANYFFWKSWVPFVILIFSFIFCLWIGERKN